MLVSYHLSSPAFLSSSICTANLSLLGDVSFSSLALLSSSVSMANLSCLLETTFSSLRLLSNSLSSPCFNLLRMARRCFLWFVFSHLPQPFFPLSSVAEDLFALSFPFLSETKGQFLLPKNDFEHARTYFRLRILVHDRHTDQPTDIYHPKSRLNTPVWGSLRSPSYEFTARNDGFCPAPEIDFCYETKARKVMVDFKFDSLCR